jgi:DNA-binding response OmpR family regulator
MKTVVLIEDDPMVALAFGTRLKAMGYLVHTACDAITAVSQVRKVNPDVVLLDISLPGGDGFVVAERISRMAGSAATPIIFMTASQRPDLRKRAMQLGAAGFLHKPFDATALAHAIESALSPGDNWRPDVKAQDAY